MKKTIDGQFNEFFDKKFPKETFNQPLIMRDAFREMMKEAFDLGLEIGFTATFDSRVMNACEYYFDEKGLD